MTRAPSTSASSISVVVPTLHRPREVDELLETLTAQTRAPTEVIVVDGAAEEERDTEEVVARRIPTLPFPCRYLRHARGTSIQRNAGIERARGELIALLDDDVRPEPDYLEAMARVFADDTQGEVGGVVGYRTNKHFAPDSAARWRWYRRLRLLREFEPGRYDFECGYPINVYMQPPFSGRTRRSRPTTPCRLRPRT